MVEIDCDDDTTTYAGMSTKEAGIQGVQNLHYEQLLIAYTFCTHCCAVIPISVTNYSTCSIDKGSGKFLGQENLYPLPSQCNATEENLLATPSQLVLLLQKGCQDCTCNGQDFSRTYKIPQVPSGERSIGTDIMKISFLKDPKDVLGWYIPRTIIIETLKELSVLSFDCRIYLFIAVFQRIS
ncbi:hypothetical protein CEXT_510671 [Caerostris extrusa]|uniref:Uncharacterized protein n=1 Tax=Caerostris extrusa TaxID=172846 RepID=A0AAV4XU54_CAEEX|nr:hypothetical protein CEXT_510671 [Caerostris extrusa]